MELNKINNNNNNNNNRAEWKFQLIKKKKFYFYFCKPVEIFMVSDTENIIDTLFNTILNKIQQAMETSNEKGSRFTNDSVGLLYYHFQRTDIRRGGSYIASPDWIVNKKATINPKNGKDNQWFKWSIIAGLNYNKIKEKELKKLLKFRRADIDFSETGKSLNKKMLQLLLISYFYDIIVKK